MRHGCNNKRRTTRRLCLGADTNQSQPWRPSSIWEGYIWRAGGATFNCLGGCGGRRSARQFQRCWDEVQQNLITKLDKIFAEIYFVLAGKKVWVLHPTFATNTDEGHEMWTKYHTRIVEAIIQFESDTTGHWLPVGFAVRVYLMLFWNCSQNKTHPFPLFSSSTIKAYKQILQSVENTIIEVRYSSMYLNPSPSEPVR
jgi:hypothetical protein